MPEIYPLEWSNERLKILDQTKLPKEQAVIIANNYDISSESIVFKKKNSTLLS